MKRAIIEESNVKVLEFFNRVSNASKVEKQSKISINQMMYWWTRKPLIAGRAIILSCCFDNISDVEQFLGLEAEKPYDYNPNISKFKEKLGIDPKSINILDPFGGSGNLIFPAAQLGFDVTVSDYNPLAFLIEKATLVYSTKYDSNLHDDFKKYANIVLDETKKSLGQYFRKSATAYLWSWCIRCPYCKQRFPLTNHMYVVKKAKKTLGIRIIPKNKNFKIELIDNISESDGKKYTQKLGKAVCISCTNTILPATVREDIKKHKDREIIVIQIRTGKNKEYILPTTEDKKQYNNAIKMFQEKYKEFEMNNLIPTENILASHRLKNTLWNYGMMTWDQYFDSRQMLVLCTMMQNIKKICTNILDTPNRQIIATYLAFILAKRLDHAGFGVIWDAGTKQPVHLLTKRQPSITYNFAESNPFEKINGSVVNIINSISRSIKFISKLNYTTNCKNESVTKTTTEKYDLIITDPPYGDDVQYGELSEFFYVWVYRILNEYDKLPSRVPLDEDYCESQGRFGNKQNAKKFFGEGLKKSFKSIADKLKNDGLAVIFFSHSSTEVWNQFLIAVQESKLQIVSSYAIHTEMSTNPLANNKASFMSSIMVTCRKILSESAKYFEDLIPEIDDDVTKILDDISEKKLLELPLTDLLVMVYGKVLEICTQHTVLKSYAKNFTPDFEELIKDARTSITRHLIVKLLKRQPDIIGSKMSFYILCKVFSNGQMSVDNALIFVRAYNTNLDVLINENIIERKGSAIYLKILKQNIELEPEKIDPKNLHQQLSYLVSNESKLDLLLHHDNIKEQELKPIISLLIKNHNLKRNQNYTFTPEDNEDFRILKIIADHMGIDVSNTYQSKGKLVKDPKKRAKKSMGDENQSRLEKWK